MNTQTQQFETKRLDHLGIVAGICNRIKLIERIDNLLPSPSNRTVSCGQATQAMVLNALGLSGRALYLMPEYLENKPVDLLIGEGLEAKDFNDDTLGRALDELQQAGITGVFGSLASAAVKEYGIEREFGHVDSSSFSLSGSYDSDYAEGIREKYEAVKITYGYSKDKRPDLKQIVVNLITSQRSALPVWLEALDGNSSDQTSFRSTVTDYCEALESEEIPRIICDSAGYTAENLNAWDSFEWITRVPETIRLAQDSIRIVKTEEMEAYNDNYKLLSFCTWYANVKQRWLLVYSQKAWERETRQLRRKIEKQQKGKEQAWGQLCRQQISCEADAMSTLEAFTKSLKWWKIESRIVPIKKYAGRGRPSKNSVEEVIGWRIEGELKVDEKKIEEETRWLGRFILATNVVDEEELSSEEILESYKSQSSSVERGFRFLKDPMFFADSLFLKSPARIMAMIMVMGLALLIYALAERELRLALSTQNEKLPDQRGKPTQKITMRRIAQMFEGVDVLIVRVEDEIVSRQVINMTPVRQKIIELFHPSVGKCYLLDF